MTIPGSYGDSFFGSDPYGSNFLYVVSATTTSPESVVVQFNSFLDFNDPAVLSPSNYTITPSLIVSGVTQNTLNSVTLVTSAIALPSYEVQVGTAQSLTGLPLNPSLNYAFFTGSPPPTFLVAGMTPTRVRLVFSAAMFMNTALTDPSSYTVTNLQGGALTILSVTLEQPTNPLSLILTLAPTGMSTTEWYQVVVSSAVQTQSLLSLSPLQHIFQFVEPASSFNVSLQNFTGEVKGGLFGNPDGLVFFSPALQVPFPNSIIQVEDVDVCSTAYDKYCPPQPIDPNPFFTWSPIGPKTTLGQSGTVLWAGFPRLMEATLALSFTGSYMVDLVPPPLDSGCSITMQQRWDPAYIALLNDPAWFIFNDTGTSVPPMFICANNLTPIPPGAATTFTILRTAFPGAASTQATLSRTLGPTAALGGGASVVAELTREGDVNFQGGSNLSVSLIVT